MHQADNEGAERGARDATKPAQHDRKEHDDDEIVSDRRGCSRERHDQRAGNAGKSRADHEGEHVRAPDIYTNTTRCYRIVGGRAHGASGPGARKKQVQRNHDNEGGEAGE